MALPTAGTYTIAFDPPAPMAGTAGIAEVSATILGNGSMWGFTVLLAAPCAEVCAAWSAEWQTRAELDTVLAVRSMWHGKLADALEAAGFVGAWSFDTDDNDTAEVHPEGEGFECHCGDMANAELFFVDMLAPKVGGKLAVTA